jgi:ribonuclease P protein component
MQFTYPKHEKLENSEENAELIKMGVSVSKKYFKKAVDRNYYKRVLRETYRLNKHLLIDSLQKPYAFMLFYQTKERLSYQEIEEKTIQLFQKFSEITK